MRTKSELQREHAKKRAMERYGLTLNREQYGELVKKIQRGNARLMQKQSLRVSVWEIEIRGFKVLVVYDKKRHNIVTFLPPEAYNNVGMGEVDGIKVVEEPPCPCCEGDGEVECRNCCGTGKKREKICDDCDGYGKVDCVRCCC